jgi:hypothetical protein
LTDHGLFLFAARPAACNRDNGLGANQSISLHRPLEFLGFAYAKGLVRRINATV